MGLGDRITSPRPTLINGQWLDMKKILVIDDESRITRLAHDYLEHAGFAVVTAADGPAALQVFRAEKPDLVVLDLGLPGLDGLDVTRALRKDSNVPVIMLTARGEEADKLVGLELGPTPSWFAEVWMPLVCFSYGAHAMPREARPRETAAPLLGATAGALRAALHAERRAAEARLWERAAAMPEAHFDADEEERLLDLSLYTVQSDLFSGQVVEQDGRPVYASVAARPEWLAAA